MGAQEGELQSYRVVENVNIKNIGLYIVVKSVHVSQSWVVGVSTLASYPTLRSHQSGKYGNQGKG